MSPEFTFSTTITTTTTTIPAPIRNCTLHGNSPECYTAVIDEILRNFSKGDCSQQPLSYASEVFAVARSSESVLKSPAILLTTELIEKAQICPNQFESTVQLMDEILYLPAPSILESQNINSTSQKLLDVRLALSSSYEKSGVETYIGQNLAAFMTKQGDPHPNFLQGMNLLQNGSFEQRLIKTNNTSGEIFTSIDVTPNALTNKTVLFLYFFNTAFYYHNESELNGTDSKVGGCEPVKRTGDGVWRAVITNGTNMNDNDCNGGTNYIPGNVNLLFKFNNSQKLIHFNPRLNYGFWLPCEREWSHKNCRIIETGNGMVAFQCNHTTDFALLIECTAKDFSICDQNLAVFGYCVTGISAVALCILIFYLVYSALRRINHQRPQNQEKMGIVLVFALSLVIFLTTFNLTVDQSLLNLTRKQCEYMGAVLYALLLSTFFCSFFKGLDYYRYIVKVFVGDDVLLRIFTNTKFMIGFCSVVPTAIVVLLWNLSGDVFDRNNDGICWINPYYVLEGLIVPCSIMLLFNLLLTVMLVQRLFRLCVRENSIVLGKTNYYQIFMRLAILLSAQMWLGLPWVLMYGTYGKIKAEGYHYAFTFFTGSQGLWILLTFILETYFRRKLTSYQPMRNRKPPNLENRWKSNKQNLSKDHPVAVSSNDPGKLFASSSRVPAFISSLRSSQENAEFMFRRHVNESISATDSESNDSIDSDEMYFVLHF